MTNEQIVRTWSDAIEAHNFGRTGNWSVRFELDGVWLVEQTVKRLEAIGVTLQSNGGPLEHVVQFPQAMAAEVATILVDQGARLSPNQALAPLA